MRAFVTGGTGFLGRYLVRHLLANAWSVRVLARHPARARTLPREVDVIAGDLLDDGAVAAGARDCDVVFHLAAATAGPWSVHASITVNGTRAILRACEEGGVSRCVLVSSVAVYEKRRLPRSAVIDESAPLVAPVPASGAYARGKVEAEQVARQWTADGHRPDIVIVRPGLIYAAERLVFPHLGELVGATRVAYGSPSLLLPLIEVRSCAEALVRAATSPAAANKTYHVVDAHATTRREFLHALEMHTDCRQRTIFLPAAGVGAFASVFAALQALRGKGGDSGVSAAKIRERAIEVRYDTGALQRDTGWRPLATLDAGLGRCGVAPKRGAQLPLERVGLVGAGAIARTHLSALRRVAGASIVGVLDTDEAAAKALAAEAGGVPMFTDSARFYSEARPQIVHVLTPPQYHAVAALRALAAGSHVLLEKPAATAVEDCDAMTAAAARTGLTVGVDDTLAWDPLIRRARAAVLYGWIGELVHVDVFMSYDLRRGGRLAQLQSSAARWERRLAGGPLEDLLPHPLAAVRAVCGALEPRDWCSMSSGRLSFDCPDELRLSLGRDGVTAHVGLSFGARPDDFTVTVRGSRATLHIDVQNMLFDCVTPVPGPRVAARGLRVLRSASRALFQTGLNAVAIATRRSLPPASPAHLLQRHYRALRAGEPPPAPLTAVQGDLRIARLIWPVHAAGEGRFGPLARNAVLDQQVHGALVARER